MSMSLLGARGCAVVGALLAALVLTPGCASWSKTSLPPQADASPKLPNPLRVELKDGRRLTMSGPIVVGDSLTGLVHAQSRVDSLHSQKLPSGQWRVTVAMADVRSMERSHVSAGKTVLFGLAIAGLAAGIAIAIAFSDWQPGQI